MTTELTRPQPAVLTIMTGAMLERYKT